MAQLADLPPDQRALLQLMLRQRRSYAEVGEMLHSDADRVRSRAVEALGALAPQAGSRLTRERQGEITDYLLGQQRAGARGDTREYLAGSAGARGWARAVAGELSEHAREPLPEIPDAADDLDEDLDEPAPVQDRARARAPRRGLRLPRRASSPPGEGGDEGGGSGAPVLASSRLGGILLLLGLAIVVAVLIVVLVTRGGDDNGASSTIPTTPSTQQTTKSAPVPVALLNLTATPLAPKGAVGAAEIARYQGRLVLGVRGQKLKPITQQTIKKQHRIYEVWLTGGPKGKDQFLNYALTDSKGNLSSVPALVPSNYKGYKKLIVTMQSLPPQALKKKGYRPSKPGNAVLSGNVSSAKALGGAGAQAPSGSAGGKTVP